MSLLSSSSPLGVANGPATRRRLSHSFRNGIVLTKRGVHIPSDHRASTLGGRGVMTDDEWREWSREHCARYEVRPLVAMKGDQQVQVGFEFELTASLPAPATPGESREPAI